MYFKLNKNYALRGWNRLPFGLQNLKTGKVLFFDKDQYYFLLLCDGISDIDPEILSEEEKTFIRELESQNIISKLKEKVPITKKQEYIKYPNRYMRSAQWSITGKCNYKCKHCFLSADSDSIELSTRDCFKIIDELSQCGINSVSITGGEPLIRPDFLDIVDYLIAKDIKISTIYTNGKLINKDLLHELKLRDLSPTFSISYDGLGWHDWLRGTSSAEDSAIRAFRLCKDYNFRTTASMCLHKNNKETIRDTVLFLKEIGVSSLKITRAYSVGNWEKEDPDLRLTPKEVYDIFLDYLPKYYEDDQPIPIQLENFFASIKKDSYAIPGIRFSGKSDCLNKPICGHIRTNFYISPSGEILPCMPLANSNIKKIFPNMLKESLSSILNDSEFMELIDTRVSDYLNNNSECRHCNYNYFCAGGCRGVALSEFNTTNDYFQKDPVSCEFFKNGYPKRIRKILELNNFTDQDLY